MPSAGWRLRRVVAVADEAGADRFALAEAGGTRNRTSMSDSRNAATGAGTFRRPTRPITGMAGRIAARRCAIAG